jgi:hypothetical protein
VITLRETAMISGAARRPRSRAPVQRLRQDIDIVRGRALRHDHGSSFMAEHVQNYPA